ncbi:hypothetical protein BHM03_00045539 [Ensete ventricosum]|nr:hypothetical protein BHM03_00045539 [Ensete ventricosum]
MIQVHLISTIILSIASCVLFLLISLLWLSGASLLQGELCCGIVTEVKENDVRFHRYSYLFTLPLALNRTSTILAESKKLPTNLMHGWKWLVLTIKTRESSKSDGVENKLMFCDRLSCSYEEHLHLRDQIDDVPFGLASQVNCAVLPVLISDGYHLSYFFFK